MDRNEVATELIQIAKDLMADWQSAGQKWLEEVSSKSFSDWVKTPKGKRWMAQQWKKRAKSPYQMGFSLPQWHHDAIDALGKGDEERFKAIKMTESMYL